MWFTPFFSRAFDSMVSAMMVQASWYFPEHLYIISWTSVHNFLKHFTCCFVYNSEINYVHQNLHFKEALSSVIHLFISKAKDVWQIIYSDKHCFKYRATQSLKLPIACQYSYKRKPITPNVIICVWCFTTTILTSSIATHQQNEWSDQNILTKKK